MQTVARRLKATIMPLMRFMPIRFLARFLLSPRPDVAFFYLLRLLASNATGLPFKARCSLVFRLFKIDDNVENLHSLEEYFIPIYSILCMPDSIKGCVVEAGAYKGCGTAKLSVACKLAGRKLYVLDSFEGLPDNDEPTAHTSLGYSCEFNKGEYCGALEEVIANVKTYGEIDVCSFIKGYFKNTCPTFSEPVAVMFCDVDLASSYKDLLQHLWLQVSPGGRVYSQDAHIPLVCDVLQDAYFWRDKCTTEPPPRLSRYTKRFGVLCKNLSQEITRDYTLSSNEVSEIYNNGAGRFYTP